MRHGINQTSDKSRIISLIFNQFIKWYNLTLTWLTLYHQSSAWLLPAHWLLRNRVAHAQPKLSKFLEKNVCAQGMSGRWRYVEGGKGGVRTQAARLRTFSSNEHDAVTAAQSQNVKFCTWGKPSFIPKKSMQISILEHELNKKTSDHLGFCGGIHRI